MLDKISNQKLFFISLIGIVVTSMILTTTFAYQSIRVNYSEGADSEVSINAGTLDVKYCRNDECVDPNESENNYNKISVDNLSFLPDYKTASYVEFVVDNRSSSDDVAYMISLTDLVYNKMFVSEAFKYTVVVVNEDGTLTEIITDNFSTLTGDSFDLNLEDRIYKYIEKGKTERVRIYLWLDENVDVQLDLTDTSERKFTGVVNVSSIFEGEVPTKILVDSIMNDTRITKNEDTPIFSGIADYKVTGDSSSGEIGMYSAEDDYGDSWYFRGAQSYNYVEFAGFVWRVVRINGDNSLRLILDGSLDKVTKEGEDEPVYKNEKLYALDADGLVNFYYTANDNAFVGYMYGDFENTSVSYDDAHENIKDSKIKKYLDTFYEEYLINYQDYLGDELFCNDKTISETTIGLDNTGLGYSNNKVYYSSIGRLVYSNGITPIKEAKPSLECAKGALNTFSRYTSKLVLNDVTEKGIYINNNLSYPIGLITADELVMAGAFKNTLNISYYLYDAYKNSNLHDSWWTMTPRYFHASSFIYFSLTNEKSLSVDNVSRSTPPAVRPVINLKSTVKVLGAGTYYSPYRVKLSE